jgi:hypothetical protein
MRSRNAFGALALSALFLSGCAESIANLTIVSTKTTDFSAPHERAASQASASDGRMWITILPLGGAPSIDAAINELLQKYNGDYLTDAHITDGGWTLLLISGGSISVKADVWKASSQPTTTPMSPTIAPPK